MENLTREIVARAIADAVVQLFEMREIDFSDVINNEGAAIANEIHKVLNKYGFEDGIVTDENADFNAIEEIVSIYEKHGYSGGSIHDFG